MADDVVVCGCWMYFVARALSLLDTGDEIVTIVARAHSLPNGVGDGGCDSGNCFPCPFFYWMGEM